MTASGDDRENLEATARATAPMQRYCRQLAHALPLALKQHKLFLAIVLAYWIVGLIVCGIVGVPWTATVTIYLSAYLLIVPSMALCLIAGRGLVIMIAERPALPLTQLRGELRSSIFTPQRIANAVPILVGMLILGGTFTVIKKSISYFAPFSWDVTFEQWDRWLHGGVAPWQLLYPLFGSPVATQILNWAYNGWLIVLNLIWVWQAFSLKDNRLRSQFFLTFILSWIVLGSAAALLFSSAGPCYFGRVTGLPDPYAPLMSHLEAINQTHALWALNVQEKLWQLYITSNVGLGAGISAMPSLHVAKITLFALLGWRMHRWLGIVLTIYAIMIMIGSVLLGWHYAIDGYAGALGMCAIWWLVGRLLEQRDKGSWTRLAPESAVADEAAPR